MTRAAVVADGRLLTISTLEARKRGDIFQAIVVARLRDAMTGAPTSGRASVVGGLPGVSTRATADGYAGLVGQPSRVVPGLAGQSYTFRVSFEVDGYAPRVEEVVLAQDLTFPGTFSAADLGDLALHRDPVRVEVQAYELDAANDPVPLSGATVLVDRSANIIGQVPAASPLLGIGPGLSRPRPSGSTVSVPTLTMPAEPERRLLTGVASGAEAIVVDNRGSLTVGDLVALDSGVPERAEWIEVTAIDGPVDPLSPTLLSVRHPLRHGHRSGDTAGRVVASSPGAAVGTLTRAALAGDWTLGMSALAGVATGQVVRIAGGGHAPEYRAAALYRTTTSGDGIALLPPMTGLAAVRVRAVLGGLNASALVTLSQPAAGHRLELTLE